VIDVLDEHVDRLRRRLLAIARHVHGGRVLMHEIYGVGAMTSLALCAWLGGADRFSSSRHAAGNSGHVHTDVQRSQVHERPRRLPQRAPAPSTGLYRLLCPVRCMCLARAGPLAGPCVDLVVLGFDYEPQMSHRELVRRHLPDGKTSVCVGDN
jgi:hypothetical protein